MKGRPAPGAARASVLAAAAAGQVWFTTGEGAARALTEAEAAAWLDDGCPFGVVVLAGNVFAASAKGRRWRERGAELDARSIR